jgi:hypothetical protein
MQATLTNISYWLLITGWWRTEYFTYLFEYRRHDSLLDMVLPRKLRAKLCLVMNELLLSRGGEEGVSFQLPYCRPSGTSALPHITYIISQIDGHNSMDYRPLA